jgi:hypothetical protein
MRRQGTTTVEIKSGYGLSVDDERRCLEVARQLTEEVTFLGAHLVPPEYDDDPDGYVALVTGPMLDACAPLARWIDVFVEEGAFDAEAARTILAAGRDRGLGLRVHANQLRPGPGVQLACELGAASADHCTHLTDADVTALADSGTVATLVPGADFSTRSPVYPDGRSLWDAGATVAVATDCNPGTSYTTSMPFAIALAVRECGLTPSEAVWAATAGGAAALRRDDVGRLAVGSPADLTVIDAPSHLHLAYRPGVPLAPDGDEPAADAHDVRAEPGRGPGGGRCRRPRRLRGSLATPFRLPLPPCLGIALALCLGFPLPACFGLRASPGFGLRPPTGLLLGTTPLLGLDPGLEVADPLLGVGASLRELRDQLLLPEFLQADLAHQVGGLGVRLRGDVAGPRRLLEQRFPATSLLLRPSGRGIDADDESGRLVDQHRPLPEAAVEVVHGVDEPAGAFAGGDRSHQRDDRRARGTVLVGISRQRGELVRVLRQGPFGGVELPQRVCGLPPGQLRVLGPPLLDVLALRRAGR